MASLKEVKNRIASVNSTRKITSAMKMVASSKLHRAQQDIENMRPYEQLLDKISATFANGAESSAASPYTERRMVKRAVIVLFTSNSSLCGGFNGNIIKAFRNAVKDYEAQGIEIASVVPFGRKAAEAARKAGFPGREPEKFAALLDHPSYPRVAEVARGLMHDYASGTIDEVRLIYHHFKSSASQLLTQEIFLPAAISAGSDSSSPGNPTTAYQADYLIEPGVAQLQETLIPKSIQLKLYTALLDSLASEHAARVIAMQIATDNADELLRQLTLTYNKTRQQAITAELLDIVGGSMQ
ncbi:MAG: ATP synthase F1 subunit gamma [Prevotellaceae bacterium]|nr:ATP synthase F1 subunit gamma [Prevotellaceae bacterium]